MQPINYNIDVKSPFEQSLTGIQAGIGIANAMDQSDARKQALAKQQFDLENQKAMQTDLWGLAQNKNPTAQDFAAMTTKYPQLAEHFKNTWSMLNTDQQQTRLGQASQIYAALSAGQPEIAANLAKQQSEALKNAGQEQDAQSMGVLSQLIEKSPETAKTSTGLLLSSILGPEKFASTFSTIAKLPGEVAQGEAVATQKKYEAANTPERLALESRKTATEMRNMDSQIAERASRLSLDRDKLQSEVELKMFELEQKNNTLDDGARKIVNDSVISSVTANQSSAQKLDLANRLEKAGGGYGGISNGYEWLKSATGNQDAMSQLRAEYNRIKVNQVLKSLPPGPATDKDVKLAMEGVPPATADSAVMASFLRGMAKLNQLEAVTENAKAEWVGSVGNLGKARKDITVDGVNVPKGATFPEFATTYLATKADQLGKQQAQQQTTTRGYMKYATPGGAS